MHITKIILENFKGFERRELNFTEKFTLLIGNNGSGKTTVLDGLAVGLGAFLLGLEGIDSRNIKKDEVRRKKLPMGEITTMEPQFPAQITCSGVIEGETYEWNRSLDKRKGKTRRIGAKDVITYSDNLQRKVSSGDKIILPVIAYYGTGRLHILKKEKSVRKLEPGSRMEGYLDCLDPVSNWKLFESWFSDKVIIELQRKKTLGILESVRKAVSNCMVSWTSIDYDFDLKEVVAIKEDGEKLPFIMLSDGVRNMLSLIADIAFRMSTLNPHLGEKARLTHGVVLIDELDLHLHPKWQRFVVSKLKETFPNVQFIVSSHSPFLIQSLLPGELQLMQKDDDDELVDEEMFYNKSLEDIVENVMEIPFPLPQRSHHLQKMYEVAQKYYELLETSKQASKEEKERLKERLDELSAPYSDNVAYYAFLESKRLLARMGRDKDETD